MEHNTYNYQNTLQTQVSFQLPYSYRVFFCEELFNRENMFLADFFAKEDGSAPHRILVFVDQGVADTQPGVTDEIQAYAATHSDQMCLVDKPQILPGGEQCKNTFDVCQSVINRAKRTRLCRQSYIVAVGGGAFLDAVGFAASLIHRGVRLIRVPTTVLAQNDSGVGVKNGVNLNGAKNYLGTFAPPSAVFNDSTLLKTLSQREQRSGIAEAFKVGIIEDYTFLDWLCEHTTQLAQCEDNALSYMIRRCAELHVRHIMNEGDPFETGSARPLDFGHWAAHKLESLSFNELRHGEAVAVGMSIDLLYAAEQNFIKRQEAVALINTIKNIGLPVWHEALGMKDMEGDPVVLAGIEEFREHLGGELCITLPSPLGAKREVSEADSDLLCKCINELYNLSHHNTKSTSTTEQSSL